MSAKIRFTKQTKSPLILTVTGLVLIGCVASAEDQAPDNLETEKHARFAETQADCLKLDFETQGEVIACMKDVTARDAARLDAEIAAKQNVLKAEQQSGNQLDKTIAVKSDEFDDLVRKELEAKPH